MDIKFVPVEIAKQFETKRGRKPNQKKKAKTVNVYEEVLVLNTKAWSEKH